MVVFSIIVPVYNVENELSRCVESILNQNYDAYELILVDDGSSDSSGKQCDIYEKKHSAVKAIHKKNGGASSARNVGIRVAKGAYLCFLDSDDYWEGNDILRDLVAIINTNHADIIRSGIKKLKYDSNELPVTTRSGFEMLKGLNNEEVIKHCVTHKNLSISASALTIRREFIINHNLWFKEGVRVEDLDWAIRVYLCQPTWDFYDKDIYVYRNGRPGSVTDTIDFNHLKNYDDIITDLLSVCKEECPEMRQALVSYLMYHEMILIALIGNAKISKYQKKALDTDCKRMCDQYIDSYLDDPRVRRIRWIYKVFGYSGTQKVLALYLRNRGR